MKFILAVISGELVISNRKRAAIEADLVAQGFDKMPKTDAPPRRGAKGIAVAAEPDDGDADEAAAEAEAADGGSYEYLLSMAISSLTEEKVRLRVLLAGYCRLILDGVHERQPCQMHTA